MRISLPAYEISFSFHPFNLLQTLSLIWAKLEYFAHPTKEGRPRYLSYCWITGTPSMAWMLSLMCRGVELLKKRVVFWQFICWPEACSYSVRISWIHLISLVVALQNSRESSAKKRCVSFGPLRLMETPCISPAFFALWRSECRPSTYKRNR